MIIIILRKVYEGGQLDGRGRGSHGASMTRALEETFSLLPPISEVISGDMGVLPLDLSKLDLWKSALLQKVTGEVSSGHNGPTEMMPII